MLLDRCNEFDILSATMLELALCGVNNVNCRPHNICLVTHISTFLCISGFYRPKVDTHHIVHLVTDAIKAPSVFFYTCFIFCSKGDTYRVGYILKTSQCLNHWPYM